MGMNGYSVRAKNKPSPGLRRATVLWAAPTWPALIGWPASWTAPEAWRAWRKWWIAGSIRPACVLRSITSSRNVRAFTTPIPATNWNTAAIFCSKAAGNWTRSIKGSLTARADCWTCPDNNIEELRCGKRLEKLPGMLGRLRAMVVAFLGVVQAAHLSFVDGQQLDVLAAPSGGRAAHGGRGPAKAADARGGPSGHCIGGPTRGLHCRRSGRASADATRTSDGELRGSQSELRLAQDAGQVACGAGR